MCVCVCATVPLLSSLTVDYSWFGAVLINRAF